MRIQGIDTNRAEDNKGMAVSNNELGLKFLFAVHPSVVLSEKAVLINSTAVYLKTHVDWLSFLVGFMRLNTRISRILKETVKFMLTYVYNTRSGLILLSIEYQRFKRFSILTPVMVTVFYRIISL